MYKPNLSLFFLSKKKTVHLAGDELQTQFNFSLIAIVKSFKRLEAEKKKKKPMDAEISKRRKVLARNTNKWWTEHFFKFRLFLHVVRPCSKYFNKVGKTSK